VRWSASALVVVAAACHDAPPPGPPVRPVGASPQPAGSSQPVASSQVASSQVASSQPAGSSQSVASSQVASSQPAEASQRTESVQSAQTSRRSESAPQQPCVVIAPVCDPAVADADVRRAVETRCASCHAPGGVAGHDFPDLEALRAAPVATEVGTCQMPPVGISEAERRMIVGWAACRR
jgi:hypothetical protein